MNLPLRTEVDIQPSKWDFNYQSPALFMGSCFSDHIGGILLRCKFPVLLNPFGVLYNPISLSTSLKMILNQDKIRKEELLNQDKIWHSFQFHGSFSDSSPEKVIEKCNNSILNSHQFIKKARFLFITFGTAWVFRYKETGKIVSNCHKIPSTEFERFRLSIDEIKDEWIAILSQLQSFNPDLKIIFTVSPIRHFKDGAHENQLSKSTLLLVIDEIINTDPNKQIGYFPSYELMNDELRDYRFYDSDMVHISETGIRFIFEKFRSTFFTDQTNACFDQIQPVIQAVEHRILNNDTQSIRRFSQTMISKIEKLRSDYPHINFQPEIEHFEKLEGLE
jgi:hypothetical protein